ncbi:CD2 antigen cytoplasmic tail-binding protein 2 [Senna tora]|uniref:CD2 antigen cytoplasmic tail-binding protein 2 n=1 Tax=Senna tora TaxID=362788 RepID=A0A834SJQ9_9FABA|nr:CD2 antigen cytoplasmic tail-binding protein 2 [Senna tora]
MEGSSSRINNKRPFLEDDDDFNKPPARKRVRFPKGKKVRSEDEVVVVKDKVEDENDLTNPRNAAKERAKHRSQMTTELFSEDSRGIVNDISAAEVKYEINENFVDDGIQIEPFNLNKEREEGYFDAAGNFVEYARENEIKDAWLDNVEVEPKYSALSSAVTSEEVIEDLSSKDVGVIKRRIANVLEPGETVLQALRRLKGNSDRKAKMSAETKVVFDQLTEDAMKLMENGEYDVYHEKKEVFQREAEGYEKLALARGDDMSLHSGEGNSYLNGEKDLLSNGMDSGLSPSTSMAASGLNVSTTEVSGNGGDEYDMFAEDDENDTAKPSTDGNNAISQPSSNALNSDSEGGALQNDYVYDESSGYYYSSSLGYYYDPNTGLYCSAVSGQWYSFNEETGTYDEVQAASSNTEALGTVV